MSDVDEIAENLKNININEKKVYESYDIKGLAKKIKNCIIET